MVPVDVGRNPVSADPVGDQRLADRLHGDVDEGCQLKPPGVPIYHGEDILEPLPPRAGEGSHYVDVYLGKPPAWNRNCYRRRLQMLVHF